MRIAQFAVPAVIYTVWSNNHGNLMLDSNGYGQAITVQAHTNITLNPTSYQPNQLDPGVFLTSPFDHDLSRTKWYFTKYGHEVGVRLNNTNKIRRSYGRGRRITRRAIASECTKFALIVALIDWMLTFFGLPSLRETLNGETGDLNEEETQLEHVMSGGDGQERGPQVEESLRLVGFHDDGGDGDGWVVRSWGRGYGWTVGCERD